MVEELISPSRSKSLGAAVERALLVDAVDAEAAVGKDRPHSATQFSRKVGMGASGCSHTWDHEREMLCVVKPPACVLRSRHFVENSSLCVRVCAYVRACACHVA